MQDILLIKFDGENNFHYLELKFKDKINRLLGQEFTKKDFGSTFS